MHRQVLLIFKEFISVGHGVWDGRIDLINGEASSDLIDQAVILLTYRVCF